LFNKFEQKFIGVIKLKIENKTSWDTKNLQTLFNLVCKHEGYKPKTVIVKYGKMVRKDNDNDKCPFGNRLYNIRIGGLGGLGYGWVKLMIPNSILVSNWDKNGKFIRDQREKLMILDGTIVKKISQVFAHEIGHNRGLIHNVMKHSSDINVDYIDDLVIHRMVCNNKKNTDVITKRYNHTIIMTDKYKSKISKLESELKKTNKTFKKWNNKKQYYEKNYLNKVK